MSFPKNPRKIGTQSTSWDGDRMGKECPDSPSGYHEIEVVPDGCETLAPSCKHCGVELPGEHILTPAARLTAHFLKECVDSPTGEHELDMDAGSPMRCKHCGAKLPVEYTLASEASTTHSL